MEKRRGKGDEVRNGAIYVARVDNSATKLTRIASATPPSGARETSRKGRPGLETAIGR